MLYRLKLFPVKPGLPLSYVIKPARSPCRLRGCLLFKGGCYPSVGHYYSRPITLLLPGIAFLKPLKH